ncbi:MAG: SH3 domain-containing protein [Ekhidna sp.]|uniref:SH3 domain-containing protein n=1 Tax=Ekhidna sp. TaxID=2608089 RepID=UPI0032EFB169
MIYRIKVRLFLGILFFCTMGGLKAQNQLLTHADSLFDQQKYTEAFSKYHQLFAEGKASSSMLLKMAFIQDGLGNYADALYFMNKYYEESADRQVIGKIEEIVKENELSGYDYDDFSYFLALLHKNQLWIMLLLVVLMVALTVYIYKKKQEDQKPMGAFVIQIVLAVMLFSVLNLRPSAQGIIISDNTLLRSGPSAGAEPIEMLTKGHKVKVLDQDEVWARIIWDGKEVFVRNGKLKVI